MLDINHFHDPSNETTQMYLCKTCTFRFTNRTIPHITYPTSLILHSLTYFNLGHTLQQTQTTMCLYSNCFPRAFFKRPLDYKSDVKKDDKTTADQLFLYALALSKRSGIPLRKISCAYFDQNNYFQLQQI